MHKYTVKPMKMDGPTMEGGKNEPKFPNVSIPADKEWLTKYSPGDDITITLTGKITDLSMNMPEKTYSRNEIRMDVHEVECNPDKTKMDAYMEE